MDNFELNKSQKEINLEEVAKSFYENDPSLRLNKIISSLENTKIKINNEDWISRTRRMEDGSNLIIVGTKKIPNQLAKLFGIAESTEKQEYVYKLSHEISHAYQREKGFEQAMLDFIDGIREIKDEHLPIVELYALIDSIGRITGLSTLQIYREQTIDGEGNLDYQIFEDITELTCMYLLSDECFLTALDRSVTPLSNEQKEEIAKRVVGMIRP